jgi:hypothetical protein
MPVLRAVPVALVAVFVLAAPGGAQKPALMLPDLDQAPLACPGGWSEDPATCKDWDVCMVADAKARASDCVVAGRIRQVRLRFTTSVDNAGDGPLVIYGHRSSRRQRHMRVRQAFADAAGSLPSRYASAQRALPDPKRNYLYYEPTPTHQHWHLMNFERFEMRRFSGPTVVRDRKNGVCLGDRYDTANAASLERRPGSPKTTLGRLHRELSHNTGVRASSYNCQMGRTASSGIRDLREGISVGSGDDYTFSVDYQWLDITRVASGTYVLVARANPTRGLRETRYDNNAASLVISIQWPKGASKPPTRITDPPQVRLLASCPDSAECAPPPSTSSGSSARTRVATTRAYACPLHARL